MISIETIDQLQYKVTVDRNTRTTHVVTIRPTDYERLTGRKSPPEELIRKSFQFLLEREPNTNILREFDLMTIQRYFPEYEEEIKLELTEY